MFSFRHLLQLRKLLALLIIATGSVAWLSGIFHHRPAEPRAAIFHAADGENHVVKDRAPSWPKTAIPETSHEQSGRNANDILDVKIPKDYLSKNHGQSYKHSARKTDTHRATLCNRECVRFQKFLMNWPEGKPKAAVYYLIQASRFDFLDASLTSLYRNFLQSFSYPVILFHEASANVFVRDIRSNHPNIRLFFQEVEFIIPAHINASAVKFGIKCTSHISYRHMCRFQAKQVYEQSILFGLDYVWRLDDDSQLPEDINYDLFAYMQLHNFQYGYMKIHFDSYDCTTGLWKAVRHYMKLRHLQSLYFEEWIEPMIFYNNFEISALSLWMSKQYQDYINYVDRLGGIYYHRWGDAPIKTVAVTLFVPKHATHLFNDVTYIHGNFYKNASYSSF